MECGLWNSRNDIAEDSKTVLSASNISYIGHWSVGKALNPSQQYT